MGDAAGVRRPGDALEEEVAGEAAAAASACCFLLYSVDRRTTAEWWGARLVACWSGLWNTSLRTKR